MIDDRPGWPLSQPVAPADSVEPDAASSFITRALAHWPRLDRGQLKRAHGDPHKMARVITRRTVLPVEAIVAILERDDPPNVRGSLDSDTDAAMSSREDNSD